MDAPIPKEAHFNWFTWQLAIHKNKKLPNFCAVVYFAFFMEEKGIVHKLRSIAMTYLLNVNCTVILVSSAQW